MLGIFILSGWLIRVNKIQMAFGCLSLSKNNDWVVLKVFKKAEK
jgi:hypothetical protein